MKIFVPISRAKLTEMFDSYYLFFIISKKMDSLSIMLSPLTPITLELVLSLAKTCQSHSGRLFMLPKWKQIFISKNYSFVDVAVCFFKY